MLISVSVCPKPKQRKVSMTNYKVYAIAAVLFVTPLLFYFYVNLSYYSYEDEYASTTKRPYYVTAIVIPMILFWLKGISQFIGKIMNYFSASTTASTYSRPNLHFQYPRVLAMLVPWNLVLLISIYITLIFYQYKIREMLFFA